MTSPTQARPRARLLAVFGVLAILSTACGSAPTSPAASSTPVPTAEPGGTTPSPIASASPTPAPSPQSSAEVDAIYDAIEEQVLAIRGLQPATVERETIGAEALQAINADNFDKDNPPDYIAGQERLYKALGLLPETASLRDTFLALVDSQVAGFYRPDAKKLYVVSRSGVVNGADKVTFAHEYDHALQDANFDIFDDMANLLDQTDTALARAAIYEGDATILMSQWGFNGGNLTPAELQDVIAAGLDPEATEILNDTPSILRESLLFPYTAGPSLLTPIVGTGGWEAIDAIYESLPVSTEQIIHPDKFASREAPIDVTLPDDLATDLGDGWRELAQDTFGEFQVKAWLADRGVGETAANQAAAGWGGDRVSVLSGPDGDWATIIRTAWDSETDAADFEAAAAVALERAGGPGQVLPGDGGTERWVLIADDDATLGQVAGVLGLAG